VSSSSRLRRNSPAQLPGCDGACGSCASHRSHPLLLLYLATASSGAVAAALARGLFAALTNGHDVHGEHHCTAAVGSASTSRRSRSHRDHPIPDLPHLPPGQDRLDSPETGPVQRFRQLHHNGPPSYIPSDRSPRGTLGVTSGHNSQNRMFCVQETLFRYESPGRWPAAGRQAPWPPGFPRRSTLWFGFGCEKTPPNWATSCSLAGARWFWLRRSGASACWGKELSVFPVRGIHARHDDVGQDSAASRALLARLAAMPCRAPWPRLRCSRPCAPSAAPMTAHDAAHPARACMAHGPWT